MGIDNNITKMIRRIKFGEARQQSVHELLEKERERLLLHRAVRMAEIQNLIAQPTCNGRGSLKFELKQLENEIKILVQNYLASIEKRCDIADLKLEKTWKDAEELYDKEVKTTIGDPSEELTQLGELVKTNKNFSQPFSNDNSLSSNSPLKESYGISPEDSPNESSQESNRRQFS